MNISMLGISTGGPKTLNQLFTGLPKLNGAIVIVLHMPKAINKIVCDQLSARTTMEVKLAAQNDILSNGCVYIAPSDLHLRLIGNRKIELSDGPKINFVKPAADIAMKSLDRNPNDTLIGIVMTGLGKDAADGIAHIKSRGGLTIAQSESTCSIGAMPSQAIATGKVDFILSPDEIREKLIEMFGIME